MSEDIKALEIQLKRLQDEYARVGKPIADNISQVTSELWNLKREAGLLYYVTTKHTWLDDAATEDFDSLGDAISWAYYADHESDDLETVRLHGPGVDSTDSATWAKRLE